MLDDLQRLLFERLSVFAGSFDLVAAEAVCADEQVDDLDVLDLLAVLVDRSLVTTVRVGDEKRYRMLETLRQYGDEQLDQRGELALWRDRHLDHYLEVAQRARTMYEGTENTAGRLLFDAEWDNIRAAFGWAETSEDAERAGGLIEPSFRYAFCTMRDEHRDWSDRATRLAGSAPDVLAAASWWAAIGGDPERGLRLGRAAVEACPSPEHPDAALAWQAVWASCMYSGQGEEMWEALQTADRVAASGDDPFSVNRPSLCSCCGWVWGSTVERTGRWRLRGGGGADGRERDPGRWDPSGSTATVVWSGSAIGGLSILRRGTIRRRRSAATRSIWSRWAGSSNTRPGSTWDRAGSL